MLNSLTLPATSSLSAVGFTVPIPTFLFEFHDRTGFCPFSEVPSRPPFKPDNAGPSISAFGYALSLPYQASASMELSGEISIFCGIDKPALLDMAPELSTFRTTPFDENSLLWPCLSAKDLLTILSQSIPCAIGLKFSPKPASHRSSLSDQTIRASGSSVVPPRKTSSPPSLFLHSSGLSTFMLLTCRMFSSV